MQRGFYIDTGICMGCYTCMAACKNWNSVAPQVTAVPGTQGPKWRRVTTVESGVYPDARIVNVSLSCMHCGKPACMAVCPAGAISKRAEDGIVVVDQKQVHRLSLLCRRLPVWRASIRGGRHHAEMQLLPGPDPGRTGACMRRELPAEGVARRHDG